MNSIKLIVYTAMLITSHNAFSMQHLLNRDISQTEVESTLLLLKYPCLVHLNPEERAQILANPDDIKNLSKSDPSVLQFMEKAKKIEFALRKNDIREKRKTL